MSRAKIAAGGIMLAASLVMGFEGLRTNAYLDPVDIPTICYGETAGVKPGQTKTPEQCKSMLEGRLAEYAAAVDACVFVPLTDYERAALTSFTYNVGVHAFCKSTSAKKFNAGDHVGGCDELLRWTKARGRELKGLVARRQTEWRVCRGVF